MTKLITRSNRTRSGNNKIAHDVERIIKKAMSETATANLKNKVHDFLANSIDNAKERSELLHKDVAKYAHKKPYRSLGLAVLTGAVIGIVITSVGNTFRRD